MALTVFRKDPVDVHHQVVDFLSEVLTGWDWRVEREPRVGTVRPDVVAYDPDGAAYVFEVETSEHAGHLGTVGQLEAYKRALEQDLGKDATAVLLVSDAAPDQLMQIADHAGVRVLGGFQNESPALRELLHESLGPGEQSLQQDVS
jgi:hypothetical protein